jgi:hypothetical protein
MMVMMMMMMVMMMMMTMMTMMMMMIIIIINIIISNVQSSLRVLLSTYNPTYLFGEAFLRR